MRLPDFLQQKLAPKKGKIVEIPASYAGYNDAPTRFSNQTQMLAYHSAKSRYSLSDGTLVGEHQGAHFFTKGQRKGLAVGGTAEPLFVIDTDVDANIIYTGQGKDHPGLYRRGLVVNTNDIHWVREDQTMQVGEKRELMARIRYRQPLEPAQLFMEENGLYVLFDTPQSAIAEGQFVAWYHEDELLGSGVIA